MTNLTIDIMAATPIGAVAPVAAATGVDFDAILTGVAPPSAPDVASPIVLTAPAYVAAPLPIERQRIAGAADPVTPQFIDLPAADGPNFWIALEVDALSPARGPLAIMSPAVEASTQIIGAPVLREHDNRVLITAPPLVAKWVVATPVIDERTLTAVVVAPQPVIGAVETALHTAAEARPAAAKPAEAAILPSPLRCALTETSKSAHKPAAVLFETTAMSPPLVMPPASEARISVSEPRPALASAPIAAVSLEPITPIAGSNVATAPQAAAQPAQGPVETPVFAPGGVSARASLHPSPTKHAISARVPTDLNDAELTNSIEGVPGEDSEPPEHDPARLQVPADPSLPIAPILALAPVSPELIAPPPLATSSVVATPIVSAKTKVTPIPTLPAVPRQDVTGASAAPRAVVPATERNTNSAALTAAPAFTVAPPPAPASQPDAPIVIDLRATSQSDIALRQVASAAGDSAEAPSSVSAPRAVVAPQASTPAQPATQVAIDLPTALQPVVKPPPTAPAATQPSAQAAVAKIPRIVVDTPHPPVAATVPPIAPVVVAPAVFAAAPAPRVRDAVTPVPVDTAGDPINTDIGPAAPVQTIASIAPHAPIIAPNAATVDTTRIDWIEALVDRIDETRGNSGHRSAHIRLLPDALGAVDVRIQHDGDRVNVSVTADNPQARAMLADAAPRLVELAESRGLKLGDAGIDQGRQGQRSADQQRPAAPPRARAAAETDSATDDMSDRIA